MSQTAMSASEILDHYRQDGFYFPVRVLNSSEVSAYSADFERVWEKGQALKLGNKGQFNFPHVVFPFAHEIVCHPKILDAVETIIGPDILVWGGTFFFKPPRSGGYVSWHQDMTYWGIEDSDKLVSAWLALDTVDQENGCMRFLKGSHRQGILPHQDTWSEDNILTRGQSVEVDDGDDDIVDVELAAGEMSLHHGHLLHASSPNHSDRWRLGFAINYISPDNRQVVAPSDYAMLVRGEDRYGNFDPVAPPQGELDVAALEWHRRILGAQNDALYDGAAEAQ